MAEPADLNRVARAYASVRPAIRRVTGTGYYDQLARGELCLAIGYSADAMVACRIAAQLGNGVHIEYSHPTETVQLYIDAYAIPASAKHWEAALRFIDFTLRPEIGVEIAHATGFAVANPAAIDRLEPELRDNHIVYPTPEVRQRFTLGRGYTMEETRRALASLAAHEDRTLSMPMHEPPILQIRNSRSPSAQRAFCPGSISIFRAAPSYRFWAGRDPARPPCCS